MENSGRGAERPCEPRLWTGLQGEGHPEADSLSRANLAANTRGWLAYSLMSRSCAGGMRGGEGNNISAPVTVA